MVKPKNNIYKDFTKEQVDHDEKNNMLIGLMAVYFEMLYKNEEAIEELEHTKNKFEDI